MTIDELLGTTTAAVYSHARVLALAAEARDRIEAMQNRPDLQAQLDRHRELVVGFTALLDILYRTEAATGERARDTTATCFVACLTLLLTGADL